MAKVVFLPAGKEVEAKIGDTLLALSQKHNGGVHHGCGGIPNCALCRVVIRSGGEFLSPQDRRETDLIGTSYYITRQRLSCQARVVAEGTVEVDMSEHLEYESRRVERERLRVEKAERERERIRAEREGKDKERLEARREQRRQDRPAIGAPPRPPVIVAPVGEQGESGTPEEYDGPEEEGDGDAAPQSAGPASQEGQGGQGRKRRRRRRRRGGGGAGGGGAGDGQPGPAGDGAPPAAAT